MLEVKWNNTDLENTLHLKYLGFTLGTTMSYNKQHIHNTKMKVATRNNLLRRSDQTPNGVVTQTLLEQLHWHCLTPRLNMRAQFGLDVVVYPLPWPLLVGGVRCSRLWSTSQLLRPSGQQCSHSGGVCPQIQGRQCGAYVGAVEEMMCVVCVDVTEGA